MAINWSKCLRQPHTYLLLAGTALGYGALLWLAGSRPMTWLGGGGIAVAMVSSWVTGFRSPATETLDSDLLNRDTFNHQIEALARRIPPKHQKPWRQTQTWAIESQDFAAHIYERDPLLQVELLEAMHTVIDLAEQVAEGFAVIDQIKTPTYHQLAQQRLAASQDRVQATHAQLQQLQDQIALASLDNPSDSSLPQRLQTLIAANKHILEDTPPS